MYTKYKKLVNTYKVEEVKEIKNLLIKNIELRSL